jgi:hypothetical protein
MRMSLPTDERKRAVLASISEVRRSASPDAYNRARRAFLCSLAELEATPSDRTAIDGRWSLVYSTDASSLSPGAGASSSDPLQAAFGYAYKAFFRFAPALAGGQDVAFLGASNEQVVDLERGVVDNTVTLRDAVQICVRGLVAPAPAAAVDTFEIVFTESELRTPLGALKIPLPRPRGLISSTFCDGEMRVVRGSRGTLFVLQRLP